MLKDIYMFKKIAIEHWKVGVDGVSYLNPLTKFDLVSS